MKQTAPKDQVALIERTIQDADFRQRLLEDPIGVITAEEYEVPAEILDQIRQMDRAALEDAIASLNHTSGNRYAAS